VAIHRLLQGSSLGVEDVEQIAAAYQRTLRALSLKDRNDPITEMIARKIIEIAGTGLRDPAEVSARAIKELGVPPP
jgi:hypothetical protein